MKKGVAGRWRTVGMGILALGALAAETFGQLGTANADDLPRIEIVEPSKERARILNTLPDGSFTPPKAPEPLPAMEVVDTSERRVGGRKIVVHRVQPPDFAKLEREAQAKRSVRQAALEAAAPKGQELERLLEEYKNHRQLSLSATIYQHEDDHEATFLSWRHDGERYAAWSSIDFDLLRPVNIFRVGERSYSLIGGFGLIPIEYRDKRSLPHGEVPTFPENAAPQFFLVEGDPANVEALVGVRDVHTLFVQQEQELIQAQANQKSANEKRLAWLAKQPPADNTLELFMWSTGGEMAKIPPRAEVKPHQPWTPPAIQRNAAQTVGLERLQERPPKRREISFRKEDE